MLDGTAVVVRPAAAKMIERGSDHSIAAVRPGPEGGRQG
jgi:hypothetical protein